MTDHELTRKLAEAMGLEVTESRVADWKERPDALPVTRCDVFPRWWFSPLTDPRDLEVVKRWAKEENGWYLEIRLKPDACDAMVAITNQLWVNDEWHGWRMDESTEARAVCLAVLAAHEKEQT